MHFLITGCGRSGTKYVTAVLQAAGLDVRHEADGGDGCVSSVWLVDDPRGYPAYHEQVRPHFDVALHQVREPLATIASLTTALQSSWQWSARHVLIEVPNPKDPQAILRTAAEYWLRWNLLAEDICRYRYRIEALPAVWATLTSLIGHPTLPYTGDQVPHLNSRPHRVVTWDDVASATPLYPEILAYATECGY